MHINTSVLSTFFDTGSACYCLFICLSSTFLNFSIKLFFTKLFLQPISSLCQFFIRFFRSTYLEPDVERSYQSVIPTRSIHRINDRKRLRLRPSRPKFYLCSMCKTHCFDTDNSDRESAPITQEKKQTTPSLKISYKNDDGQSVMDIVPLKSSRPSHKRKHRSKHKKSKKSRRDKSELDDLDTSLTHLESQGNVANDSSSDTDTKLIIDLPVDSNSKPSPVSTAHKSDNSSQNKHRKTKSKSKVPSLVASPGNASDVTSPIVTRNVSTYEGPGW